MNKPQLYNDINDITKYAAKTLLNKYSGKIKWSENGDTIIDLGCGDGKVTCLLKEYVPKNYKKFVACDISREMIKFGREHYGNENIKFIVQDVVGDLGDDLKGSFNHVFSFLLFQWIQNQKKAFQNVYELLTEDGECCMSILSYASQYHIYDILSRGCKWGKTMLKNVADDFISPYYGMKNPEERVKQIMSSVGFVDIDVQYKKLSYQYENIEELKKLVKSVDPYDMPQDVFDDFFIDFLDIAKEIGVVVDKADNNLQITYNFHLILVHAFKR